MPHSGPDLIEDLLAAALAIHDQDGAGAMDEFVRQHPDHASALRRGIDRCRQMGMLGTHAARDFPEHLGDFRLLRRLGSGGMGVVYEAEQISLGRQVALKVIRPELLYFEGARERFRREIEAVARLSHPAVVPVLASGEQDGVPFYVMELLSGRTLAEITTALAGADPARLEGRVLRTLLGNCDTEQTGLLEGDWWQVCTRLVHSVGLGIRHAHLRGIVHRDIKPSNVMVTPHGQAVLLDFGVATIRGGREFTRTGATPGSPAFMSPEQLRGDAVDERTDVYSLAATLWQTLALTPPFQGVEDLQRIRDGDVPHVRGRNREVPPELDLVIRKAMDRDRERRYPDMEAFTADLQAVLHRLPIRARRLGLGLRVVRWCQRHRVAAAALAGVLAGGALLPAAVAWRTHAANVELAAAKARADASLQGTMDALDKVLLRLGNVQLRHVPMAEAVAAETLQDAVTMYRGLLTAWPEVVRLRQGAARAMTSLAATHHRTGRTEQAVAVYGEAVQLLHEPRMDLPPEWLDGRAHAWVSLASVLANNGRVAESTAAIEAAERDYRALDGVPAFRISTLRGRGDLCSARMVNKVRSEPTAIGPELQHAVELGREQLALQPEVPDTQALLVRRLDDLAAFHVRNKEPEQAHAILDEALALARRIPVDARIWPPPRLVLAAVLQTRGNLLVEQRSAEAEATLTECLTLRQRLATDHPANLEFRCVLSSALHNLARVYVRDDEARALPLLERARDLERSVLGEQPGSTMAQENLSRTLALLGTVYAELGHYTEFAAAMTDLRAHDGSARTLRTVARQWLRMHARTEGTTPEALERRTQCTREALDLLLAAERKDPAVLGRLEETYYAPLAAEPEFVALKSRVAERLRVGEPQAGSVGEPPSRSTSSARREMPR